MLGNLGILILYLNIFTTLSYGLGLSTSSNKSTALTVSGRDGGWGGWGWGSDSGTSLHSFFDIALTALAFLSFGVFLLNLLLNALLFQGGGAGLTETGPIVTMIDTADGGGATEAPPTEAPTTPAEAFLYRKRRSVKYYHVDSITAANNLAETVLRSIDSMIEKHECLPKIICDGNRQAQLVGHGFQYLMPFYSFSSSYIGRKFGFHDNLSQHLDAILDGVSDSSNCQSSFPQCRRTK